MNESGSERANMREREDKRTLRWMFNMIVVNLVELSSESSRGLTLPTLYLFVIHLGGGIQELSILISIFSVGRLVGSTLFGKMTDLMSARETYVSSILISLLGNFIYILADMNGVSPSTGMLILTMSRFIVGFGAGNRSVCRSNVADLTVPESRMRYMTLLQATVYFGYALTPGIAASLPYQKREAFWNFNSLVHVNIYTVPGFVLCALNSFVLLCVLAGVDENMDWSHEPSCCGTDVEKASENEGIVARTNKPQVSGISEGLARRGFNLFLFLNFLLKGTLSIFETITPVLFLQVTHQSHASTTDQPRGVQIAQFLFWLGVGGLIVLLLVASQKSNRWMSDTLCWVSFLVQGFGCLCGVYCVLSPSLAALLSTEILVWSLASPVAGAVLISSFSCMLGPSKQGLSMGLIGSAGSLGRILAPPINGFLMANGNGYGVFFACAVLSFLSAALLLMFRRCVDTEKDAGIANEATVLLNRTVPLREKRRVLSPFD